MRIGVLAATAGLSARTVRFYEQAGLLAEPPRTSGGYRDYPAEAIKRLSFIREAQAAGLSLAEIRGILAVRDSGRPPCRHVTELISRQLAQVEERITELTHARQGLRALQTRAAGTDPADCDDTDICIIITG